MRHCQDKLPGFSIAFIGVSLAYSYELLKYDCVSCFNLLQGVLVGPRGARFIREAHAKGRTILAWTVNAEEWMDWGIRKGLEGIITDDPAKYTDIRKRWEHDGSEGDKDADADGRPSEATTLRRPMAIAPPTAHPPNTKSITGFFLRRWTKLYLLVGLMRMIELIFINYMRVKYGWESKQVRAALGR